MIEVEVEASEVVVQGLFATLFVHQHPIKRTGRKSNLEEHVSRSTMESVFVYLFARDFLPLVGGWEPWNIHGCQAIK